MARTLTQPAQQGVEFAVSFQFMKLIGASYVAAVDEDLRDRVSTSRALAHFLASRRRHHHIDLPELDALIAQKRLCAMAIRTKWTRIDFNISHGRNFPINGRAEPRRNTSHGTYAVPHPFKFHRGRYEQE